MEKIPQGEDRSSYRVGAARRQELCRRRVRKARIQKPRHHRLLQLSASGELYKDVFTGDVYFNRGMVAENAVAQGLTSSGRPLFFYSRRNPACHRSEMEIDFLIRRNGEISPIEVKSGKYRQHASLDKFRVKFKDRLGRAYILYSKDVMEKDGILHLPLFMVAFL